MLVIGPTTLASREMRRWLTGVPITKRGLKRNKTAKNPTEAVVTD